LSLGKDSFAFLLNHPAANDWVIFDVSNACSDICLICFSISALNFLLSFIFVITVEASRSRKYLRYLGGGWPCYTFSEPKFDIAVISLDRRMTTGFLRDLESNGYQPIVIDSIWNKSIKEGDDLVCIGYPITSRIYRLKGNLDWSASTVSLPTFSFGKIAMTDSRLPFFWGDVSTYPGDSGGPVIRQDTLVGIMSGQATFESQRIPFAYIIKINYLKDLLEKQIELYNEEQILIKSVNVK